MKSEDEINELWDETAALHRGIKDVCDRADAALEALGLLIRNLVPDGDTALDWAKQFDAVMAKPEWRRQNQQNAGLRWLILMRDDLVSIHNLMPEIQGAIQKGQVRLKSTREALRLVPGHSDPEPPALDEPLGDGRQQEPK